MSSLDTLKQLIRERDVQYFSDEELEFYLQRNRGDIESTAYTCLIIKAEDTTLSVPGMTTGDTSKYYRRLAGDFRPSNSGIVGGEW